MYKKACSIIIIVFYFVSSILAQKKELVLLDSTNLEPISYASVLFIQKDFGGIYSDEQGKVIIPDTVDEIRISQVAYKTKSINLKRLTTNKILLTPNIKELSEVVVTRKDKYKKSGIGFFHSKSKSSYGGANGFMMALYIPYDKNWETQPYISKISGLLKKVYKYEVTSLRIDLQKPDKTTKAPDGISLLNENIILKNKKIKQKNNIELQVPILFPKEGVFIIVEWIDVSNQFQNLNPFISYTAQSNVRSTWRKRIFAGDSWEVFPVINDGFFQGKVLNICFGLTILQ